MQDKMLLFCSLLSLACSCIWEDDMYFSTWNYLHHTLPIINQIYLYYNFAHTSNSCLFFYFGANLGFENSILTPSAFLLGNSFEAIRISRSYTSNRKVATSCCIPWNFEPVQVKSGKCNFCTNAAHLLNVYIRNTWRIQGVSSMSSKFNPTNSENVQGNKR